MKHFSVILFLLLFFAHSSQGQWKASNTGLYGGNITTLFSYNGNLFAGTYYDGIYLSSDNGNTWKSSSVGLGPEAWITCFLVIDNTIYAGDYFQGIWFSNDNGASWSAMNTQIPNYQIMTMVLSNNQLFIGTANGIYVTSDKGATWTTVSTGLAPGFETPSYTEVLSLKVKGSSLFAGTFNNGIYRSDDNGNTWMSLSNGIPTSMSGNCFLVDGQNIYAGTSKGIYLSSDNGDSWSALTTGLPVNANVSALVLGDNNKLLASLGNIYISEDGGSSWSPVSSYTVISSFITTLLAYESTIYAGSGANKGVIQSTDNGVTWNSTNTGFTSLAVSSLIVTPTSSFAITPVGIFKSTDHAASWSMTSNIPYTSNNFRYTFNGLIAKGDSLFVSSQAGELSLSVDNGSNWNTFSSNTSVGTVVINDIKDYKGSMVAATTSGVFNYTIQDQLWHSINEGIPDNTFIQSIIVKGNTIMVSSSTAVYASQDNGASWNTVSSTLTDLFEAKLLLSGDYVVLSSSSSTYITSDEGKSWTAIAIGQYENGFKMQTIGSTYGFVGDYEHTYFSSDNGFTWKVAADGFSSTLYSICFAKDGDTILAGTTEGVWAIPLSYFYPTIASFSPAYGSPGSTVIIEGTNFDNLLSYNHVKFNGVDALVVAATPTILQVTVPATASSGTISVTIGDHTATSALSFCVGPAKPVITATGIGTDTQLLTSSSDTGNQWFLNSQAIAGATSNTFIPIDNGYYTVQVKGKECSSSPSDGVSLIITGINSVTETPNRIYPIPARDRVMLTLDNFTKGQMVDIQIYNSVGQNIYSGNEELTDHVSLEISEYSKGIYIVKAYQGSNLITGKFIKE